MGRLLINGLMRYTVIIEDKSLPMFPRKITVNSSRAMIAHKDDYFRDVESLRKNTFF